MSDDDVPDFHRSAASLVVDEALLVDLGKASWAATELHARIQAALHELRGPGPRASRWPWTGPSVAEDARELETLTEGTALGEWCRTVAANAISARDAVVHEVVTGAPLDDGSGVAQPPQRHAYGRDELAEVTGRLTNATNTMPAGTPPRSPSDDRRRS